MCTVAASTCFREPFEKPSHKRLGWVHKKFSGNRHSDHLAMLWAFQQWEDARFVVIMMIRYVVPLMNLLFYSCTLLYTVQF